MSAEQDLNTPDTSLELLADNLYGANSRFAVYGTLGPGCPNRYRLSDINGSWSTDIVRGSLIQFGWGAKMGYSALVWDKDGPEINVQVLESRDLKDRWEWLDELEGGEYGRILVPLESGKVANIYAHREVKAKAINQV